MLIVSWWAVPGVAGLLGIAYGVGWCRGHAHAWKRAKEIVKNHK